MFRFNPSTPERRTATSSTLRSNSPPNPDSTYPQASLTAPPNTLETHRPTPPCLRIADPKSNDNQTTPFPPQRRILISTTNWNRPKGLNGPQHGEERQMTVRSLPWNRMERMEWKFILPIVIHVTSPCISNLSINCSYTILLGWINWLDLTWLGTDERSLPDWDFKSDTNLIGGLISSPN